MRIPLVSRIRPKYAVGFVVLLAAVQLAEGTSLFFAGLTSVSLLMATLAFNVAGGLPRVAGAWIFFFTMRTLVIGLVAKAFFGEAGDSVFTDPLTTEAAYCITLAIAALVAGLVRRFSPRQSLLSGMGAGEEMKKAAFGSLLLGITIFLLSADAGYQTGSFFAAIRQINHFTAMALLLATFYQVKKTGGQSSTNWIVWAAGSFDFFFGVLGYSKEGMFTPPVTWFVAAVAAGHNFSRRQLVGLFAAAIFAFTFLVPYAQLGRNFRSDTATFSQNFENSWTLLTTLPQVRKDFLGSAANDIEAEGVQTTCFEQSHGFLDRFCIFGPDDRLIELTEEGSFEGYWPSALAVYNVIPHFLWPDKPNIGVGNVYAHQIGQLAPDDDTTGISFSPTADAFHQAGWVGLLIILTPLFLLLFTVLDLLGGDVRVSPWGLLFVVLSVNLAPEGLVGGNVYLATYGALGVTCIALISKYVLPTISGVLMGVDRTRVRKTFVPVLGVHAAKPLLPPAA